MAYLEKSGVRSYLISNKSETNSRRMRVGRYDFVLGSKLSPGFSKKQSSSRTAFSGSSSSSSDFFINVQVQGPYPQQ